MKPVLIFAVGNESRGDDALGPLLLRALESWLTSSGQPERFELLEEFQLQIEHAIDLQERQLLLFIDAGMDTPDPYAFYRLQPSDQSVLYSHALAPEALLKVYQQLYQSPPPPAFVLCVRGEHYELGEGLSPDASQRLQLALDFGRRLLAEPEPDAWSRLCTTAVGQNLRTSAQPA